MFAVSPGHSSKKHDEDEVIWGIIGVAVALGIATVIIAQELHNRYVCRTYDVDELMQDPQRVNAFTRDEQEQEMDAQEIVCEAAVEDSDMDEQTADTFVADEQDDTRVIDIPDKDIPDPKEQPTMEQQM